MASSPKIQRNPDRTRRRLLRSAITLFSARGYHGVSVDQIVAMAKINKRMVYHYFGSKEELFQEALKEVYGRIEVIEFHAVERGERPREKLTRLLEGYFQFLDDNPEFTRLLQWENLERGQHISSQNHVLTKNPFLMRFRSIVEQGVAMGDFRPDLDIPHLLINFIGLCSIYHSNRFSLSLSLSLDLGDPKTKAIGLDQVIRLVFEGITVPPKGTVLARKRTAQTGA